MVEILLHSYETNRELYSPMDVKGSCIEPGRVRWFSLTLDPTGIAGYCTVALVRLLAIFARYCLHHNEVYSRVSTSANLGVHTEVTYAH